MRLQLYATAIATCLLWGFLASPLRAEPKTISIISDSDLKKQCGNNKGGVFFPSAGTGVYACLTGGGGVIVCGGGTPEQQKTCSIGRMVPGDRSMVRMRVLGTRR